MSRDIYLPPKALREIEDPTPPEPADLVEAIRGHIADHSGDPEWAATVTADEIIAFCQERIARFKAPKHIAFEDLPKTATGKIQKYVLRDREWGDSASRIQGSQVK